jgi:thioredoxin-related protein
MKYKNILLAIIGVLLWTTIPACSSGSDSQDTPTASPQSATESTGVSWYGYDEGMALGKQEGKKVLLHFYADWCIYCKKMDKEIFLQNDAAEFINSNFVPIRINTDKEQQITAEYRVSGLPTTFFLDKNGEGIISIPEYVPKKKFMLYSKFIQTDSYQSMSFNTFVGME